MRLAGDSWDTVELDDGEPIPPLESYDALISMGGPMDVFDENEYPWLMAEKTVIREAVLKRNMPFLGVCLGHQSVGQALGAKVIRAPKCMHGKLSEINHQGNGLFKDLPSPLTATRYHSLILDRASVPECLDITAETEDGIVMGIAHKEVPLYGVQFHPESIASEHGHDLLKNFLDLTVH